MKNFAYFVLLAMLFSASFAYGYYEEASKNRKSFAHSRPTTDPKEFHLADELKPVASFLGKKGIGIETNARECIQHNIVGWHEAWSNRILLCTNRMRETTSTNREYNALLGETLAHEATHVAQFCRRKTNGVPYLGVSANKLYALPYSIQNSIKQATKTADAQLTSSLKWRVEAEAFYYESRPGEVAHLLRAYC